jgi:hypothetical protein
MAVSRLARACAAVLKVIEEDYYADARIIFERTQQTIRSIPAQPNNEFRNCINHLGRACIAGTDDECDLEIEKARWHLEAAKRDCYKLAIKYLEEHLAENLRRIERAGGHAFLLHRSFRRIRNEHNAVLRAELPSRICSPC